MSWLAEVFQGWGVLVLGCSGVGVFHYLGSWLTQVTRLWTRKYVESAPLPPS